MGSQVGVEFTSCITIRYYIDSLDSDLVFSNITKSAEI